MVHAIKTQDNSVAPKPTGPQFSSKLRDLVCVLESDESSYYLELAEVHGNGFK